MGKYTNYVRPSPRIRQTNPIWRGVGCILMVVVPLISFALAELTVNIDLAQPYIPFQLMGTPYIPPILWTVGFLNPILFFIESLTNIYAVLIFMVVYIIALGTLISAVSAFFYQAMQTSRYGPLDAPPPEGKVKPYKR